MVIEGAHVEQQMKSLKSTRTLFTLLLDTVLKAFALSSSYHFYIYGYRMSNTSLTASPVKCDIL